MSSTSKPRALDPLLAVVRSLPSLSLPYHLPLPGLPLLFIPFVIGFPAGVLVYWIATNFWTMGQQAVVKIFFPPPPQPTPEEIRAAKPPPPPPKKKSRNR